MDMENAMMTVIQSLPNLAVALLALWWATKRIDTLLDQQSKLVDQLIEMMRENRRLVTNGHSDHAAK
jgi:type IV secretory pathway TrbL component